MKEPKYRRLTFEEREEISRMLALGYKIREVGRELGRDASTISREVSKGECTRNTYRAGCAQRRAERNASKRKAGKRKLFKNNELRHYVEEKLNCTTIYLDFPVNF